MNTNEVRELLLRHAEHDLQAEGFATRRTKLPRMRSQIVYAVRHREAVLAFGEPYTNLGQIVRDCIRAIELQPRPDGLRIYIPDAHRVEVELAMHVGKIQGRVVRVPVDGFSRRDPSRTFEESLRVAIRGGPR